MTTMLVDGQNSLVQNTVYAMPGRAKFISSDKSLEYCNGTTGGTFASVAAGVTTGGLLLSCAFVRSTNSGTTLVYIGNP